MIKNIFLDGFIASYVKLVRVARFFSAHFTNTGENVPQNRTKCPKNISTSSIASPSKIYPNFWFEKMPSGNPEACAHY
jgi:hypothetical protein